MVCDTGSTVSTLISSNPPLIYQLGQNCAISFPNKFLPSDRVVDYVGSVIIYDAPLQSYAKIINYRREVNM
jgi:hypothetical protein